MGTLLLLASLQEAVPIRYLTRDPVNWTREAFFIGALSHLGVLLWCGAGLICLFAAGLLRAGGKEPQWIRFFTASGLVSLFLGLDDLFLLHEGVWRDTWGLSEKLYMALLAVAGLLYLRRFAACLALTRYWVLLAAGGLLVTSLGIDLTPYQPGSSRFDPEDQLKLLGIACWFSYFCHACFDRLRMSDLSVS